MAIIEPFIMEYTHEMQVTRTVLDPVPADQWDWKPHEKSFSMGALASHIAESQAWAAHALNLDGMNIDDSYKPYLAANRDEMLTAFDANAQQALEAMQGVPDAQLMENWALTMNGEKMLEMPRIGVLRAFVLSHTIHHRGQLSVYLRLKEVPVPSIYGPSADDPGM